MVKHIILWALKPEYTNEQKVQIRANIKQGLEGLLGKIDGLADIKVYTNGLPSSNADLMLDSTFESEAALKAYAIHPEHVAVADSKVRPFTAVRYCLDFEINQHNKKPSCQKTTRFTVFSTYAPNLLTLSLIPGPIVVAIVQDLTY